MNQRWIQSNNLVPVLTLLSDLVSYRFDPADIDAVVHGVGPTNDEKDNWFEYTLEGRETIELRLAKDAESPVVLHVETREPNRHREAVYWILAIASDYILIRPGEDLSSKRVHPPRA